MLATLSKLTGHRTLRTTDANLAEPKVTLRTDWTDFPLVVHVER